MPRLDGDKVKRLRLEKGFTQEVLSEHARLSPTTVRKIEANKESVSSTTHSRIATALEVDPKVLLLTEKSPLIKPSSQYQESTGQVIAMRLLDFLEDRRVLYDPWEDGYVPYIIASVREI